MTILGLVALVLVILTVLLLQFFTRYYTDQAENELTSLAEQAATIVEHYGNQKSARDTAWDIIDTHSAEALIVDKSGQHWSSPSQKALPNLSFSAFKNDKKLSKAISSKKSVVKMGEFPVEKNGEKKNKDILIVGVPLNLNSGQGAVFLYQSLDVINHTTNKAKNLIYISAGIAIILTTIFAFFLSTRITAPLRKMRQGAMEVAKGSFDIQVPVVSRDEIGELGVAFNQMSRQLKANIDALNQEKEQLSGVLNSMADGVITFNRDGEIIVNNPPAQRFLQASSYEHESEDSQTLPNDIRDLLSQVIAKETEQMAEVTIQGRSWVVVMTPLYDNSFVRGAVAVLRDMTEERRLDKMREDFVANVSHELRTPVSMLRGYSEAIVDDIASTEEEKREIAQIIYEESLRMGRLVNDLLDLTRMEAGHIKLNKKSVDIRSFFEHVIRKFQGIADEQNVSLEWHLLPNKEDVKMIFDSDHIEQVLTNLIDNAIRHSKKNGVVTVNVEISEDGMVVRVHDTGAGIPDTDLPFVFERFYKADKARTRGKSGTGLGLAIAKNLVETHDGTIDVYSTKDQGTTFRFFLPQDTQQQ